MLDGHKITNLTEIDENTKILIASEEDEFLGVQFVDYRL